MSELHKKFEKWVKGFSGCDGGDIGSPSSPSIWVCGIEWGGVKDGGERLKERIEAGRDKRPPPGYDCWKANLHPEYKYNWNVMKLFSAMDGGKVEDYKQYAQRKKPFVKGSSGFFKMNLYPIGFPDISAPWPPDYVDVTRLRNKSEYRDFCEKHRFAVVGGEWIERYKPKMVICLGNNKNSKRNGLKDFQKAFPSENERRHKSIEGRNIYWWTTRGSLILVLPHPSGPNNLNKNTAIQTIGEHIRKLMRLLQPNLS